MLNTNFNAYFVPHQLMYPYGYQYLIMPQQFSVQNQQQYYAQPQTQISENISSIEPNHSIEAIQHKTYSETESKPEQTSNQEEIKETNIQKKIKKNNLLKKSQKPNYLVKSTNIQKNYAKAIVSFACRQRNLIYQILGETGAQEFLKLMNRLRNKLRNIAHITRYTHQENFLQMFRILGNNFLRKDSVSYIYNSKIQQKSCHVANKAIVKNSVLKY
ncbi:unnamed protein product (macronuclear) [Paramecium tetraurelia]|uniref:Uncharacterized protein n=1 Tax=Paramecium tetraurelia TaxID=5888 RepID=A0E5C4_PARTE|nr:uncharacterized protein GSPATT00023668001 [Paramecium tetraurelia]CAK90491.1 unnamed protein product [Paramecium tetraurelia]|eukprot:XP_001457888.1 hypothetical protein (macronuclear) [Paramecium tetraurelia strain d4-2]